MDTAEDKDAPAALRPAGRKSDASGQTSEREARLAAALRANLKRRKAAERQGPPKR